MNWTSQRWRHIFLLARAGHKSSNGSHQLGIIIGSGQKGAGAAPEVLHCRFSSDSGDGDQRRRSSSDFLEQLWIAYWTERDEDSKRQQGKRNNKNNIAKDDNGGGNASNYTLENGYRQTEGFAHHPPPSQSISPFLKPASPQEACVAPLLARSNLLITREIQWANVTLGFLQENRYLIVDACHPQSPVGFICERSNVIARQLLRLRRPFVAYIKDAMGNELFRVRRPFWWTTSSIYAEIDDKEVGVVHGRWHPWRRIYDLYLGNKQFAVVENPGLRNWTFALNDIDGKVLAQIDRHWRGFGLELFTDAGRYVIRFGSSDPSSKTGHARMVQDLEVVRLLSLSERAVAVALAIALDNDCFSRSGAWGLLPFIC